MLTAQRYAVCMQNNEPGRAKLRCLHPWRTYWNILHSVYTLQFLQKGKIMHLNSHEGKGRQVYSFSFIPLHDIGAESCSRVRAQHRSTKQRTTPPITYEMCHAAFQQNTPPFSVTLYTFICSKQEAQLSRRYRRSLIE